MLRRKAAWRHKKMAPCQPREEACVRPTLLYSSFPELQKEKVVTRAAQSDFPHHLQWASKLEPVEANTDTP